jgi:hypothetical protein
MTFHPLYRVYIPRGRPISIEEVIMTSYTVQFTLPVDNPVNKVRMTRVKQHMTFEVPLNHPDAHKMHLMDLIAAAELSGLLGLPTHLNKNTLDKKSEISKTRGTGTNPSPAS